MKVLVTGKGTSGSWKVRGEQLGAAIGAKVVPQCTDFDRADVVVCVKRVKDPHRLRGRFWVWDVVDAWPQPQGNEWNEAQATAWLRGELKRLKPSAVVFTTAAMLKDSGWQGPALVLPHHAWPKYKPHPLRQRVEAVGYEGSVLHLGKWRTAVARECAARGWRFEVNGDMAHCDVGVALREPTGHPPRYWKSNVKLANLQALGVPAVCSPERGYIESASGAELYVENEKDLAAALDRCAGFDYRASAAQVMRAAAPALEDVAARYRAWLAQLNS